MATREIVVCVACEEDAKRRFVIAAKVEARITITYPDGTVVQVDDSYSLCEHKHLTPVRVALDALKATEEAQDPPIIEQAPPPESQGRVGIFHCGVATHSPVKAGDRGAHAGGAHKGRSAYEIPWVPLFDPHAHGWLTCGECGYVIETDLGMGRHESATLHNRHSDKHPLQMGDYKTAMGQAVHEAAKVKAGAR